MNRWLSSAGEWILEFAGDHKVEIFYALFGVVAAVVRAAGVTVISGTTGLKFSFGRATSIMKPGFHLLFPFLQVARVLPTRSRTIDLSAQQVTTLDGLVYEVDANLVYRVVDLRKALIQIDQLEKGMLQMLGLGVQELLRKQTRSSMRVSTGLDEALATGMRVRLAPWGVEVERAGFTTITPTAVSLRLTQLASLGRTRLESLRFLERSRTPRRQALALLGVRSRILRRGQALRENRRILRRSRRTGEVIQRLQQQVRDELVEMASRRRVHNPFESEKKTRKKAS